MSNKMFQRFLTLVLISCMLIQLFPMNLKAEQNSGNTEETTSEQIQLNENNDEVTNTETENTDEQVFPDPTVIPEPTDTQETLEPTASPDASVTPGVTEEPVEKQEPVEEPVEEEQELVENPEEIVEEQETEESIEPIVEETEEPDIEVVDDGNTYLFFGSNYDKNESALTGILSRIEIDAEYEIIDYVGLTGTFVMDSTNDVFTEITIAHERLNASKVDLLTSKQLVCEDNVGILNGESGLLYEDKRVVVYGVTADSIDKATSATGDAYDFSQWISGINDSRTLVVLAESELHAETNADNKAAKYWHDAFNAAAGKRDVIVVYGGTAKDYLPVGSEMKIHQESGDGIVDTTISYSYVHAGNLTEDNSSVIVGVSEHEIEIINYGFDCFEILDEIKYPMLQTFYGKDEEDYAYVETYVKTKALSMDYKCIYGIEGDELSDLLGEFANHYSYSIDFDGYTENTPIEVSFTVPEDLEHFINFEIYHITKDGRITPITEYLVSEKSIEFTVNAPGIFIFGTKDVVIPDDAVLKSIRILKEPYKKNYVWLPESVEPHFRLTTDGLVVKGSFECADGTILEKEIEWEARVGAETGYTVTFDRNKLGPQYAEVSFEKDGIVKTDSFRIAIFYEEVKDVANDVTFSFSNSEVTAINVKQNTEENFVRKAVDGLLTNYVSYDIKVDGHHEGEKVKVTLPIPQGVDNPVVYYVYETLCTAERIDHVVSKEGYVTFITNHFSTYVIGEGGDFKPEKVVLAEKTTITDVPAWIYTNKLENGKEYLIVNSKTATNIGNSLTRNNNNSVGNNQITVNVKDNVPYIEASAVTDNMKWTAESVTSGWRFKNSGYYLGISGGYRASTGDDYSYSFKLSTNPTEDNSYDPYSGYIWTKGTDLLYKNLRYEYDWGNKLANFYLKFDNSWKINRNGTNRNVYFYEYGTVRESVTYPETILGIDVVYEGKSTTLIPYKNVLKDDQITLDYAKTSTTAVTIPDGYTASWENATNNGIATVNSSGVVTFTGVEGEEVFKVSYTWTEGNKEYTVTNYVVVEAFLPVFKVQISEDNQTPSSPIIVKKKVTAGQTVQLYPIVTDVENNVVSDIKPGSIKWESSDTDLATVDPVTGKVTLQGESGTVEIKVSYEYLDGIFATDTVVLSLSTSDAYTPEDGTNDFPEYPNEGAIRFDKHADAVGNFSDTGVVQVELSMTGVPYTTNNEIDVVIMLDMSTSMSTEKIKYTKLAAENALKTLVTNEDGSYNGNRVAIYGFNGWHNGNNNDTNSRDYYNNHAQAVYEYWPNSPVKSGIDKNSGETNFNISKIAEMQKYDESKYKLAVNAITAGYNKTEAGTNYAAALRQSYLTLQETKQEGRKQYLIFMTDGFATTGFAYLNNNGNLTMVTDTLGTDGRNGVASNGAQIHKQTEYYSELMKQDGVEIFSVGLKVDEEVEEIRINNITTTKNTLVNNGKTVLKKIAGTSAGNATTDEYADHALFIDADDDSNKIVEAFDDIAQSIKQAATNVLVTDKIADKYTMIFDFPENPASNSLAVNNTYEDFPEGENQEFFIEVLDYKLKAVTDSNGNVTDYVREPNPESLSKVYLKKDTSGNFYAANKENATFTKCPDLVFELVQNNEKETVYRYWSEVTSPDDADVTVGGKHYKFMPMGDGTHNIKSGAYVSGDNNQNIKIITPYFIYDASTRILLWTSQKLTNSELALRYFLYLDKSAGWEKYPEQTDPGTYITNDYATIRYENHLGNTCQQEFPIPQMTWHGAQVSYVFYLVNDAGQPVNRAGQVVPFSEAIYVTDVFTKSVVWNDLEETTSLESELLAVDLLPDVYELFDHTAAYQIHVFEDETGMDLNNHFMIIGDSNLVNTTYAFNTKSGKKYSDLGIYSAQNPILCKDYNVTATPQKDSSDNPITDKNGNQVYTFKYNGKLTQYDPKNDNNYIYEVELNEDGSKDFYTIVYRNDTTIVTGVDFANTTVAFAVKWQPKLAQDTVVIDYGLPVSINVTLNDNLSGGVKGVLLEAPGTNIKIDEGTYFKDDSEFLNRINTKFGTATIESENSVVYTLTDMTINTYDRFYYESNVSYYDKNNILKETNMYSSVTVIPATSIYYEDSFVKFDGYAATESVDGAGVPIYSTESNVQWERVGNLSNALQQTDRPGPDKIGTAYDADNLYGYDNAYKECSTYSLGSAMKFTASMQQYGTASFKFYGTGFDIISLTSNKTGTILVDVYKLNGSQETLTETYIVDTYYGYTYDASTDMWTPVSNGDNALYQIPVISVEGLDYGKYKAVISVIYSPNFDHGQGNKSYDFYMDAVRIFDPAADSIEITDPSGEEVTTGNKTYIKDVYLADGEYKPDYHELRNWIIAANSFDTLTKDTTPGIVFIDGIPNLSDSTNGTNTGATDDESLQYWISDYKNFGPNNELYLNAGQAVSFELHAALPENLNMYDVRVQIGLKSPTGSATYKITGVNSSDTVENIQAQINRTAAASLSTATEMYYDITDLNDKTIVIQNTAGMLSVTNIKITAALKETTDTASVSHGLVNTAMITPFMFGLINVEAEEELPLFNINPAATRKVVWTLNGGRQTAVVKPPFDDQKLPLGPEAPEDELVEVIDPTDLAVDPGDLPEIAEKREESIFEQLMPEDFFEKFNVFDPQQNNIFMRILSFIANFFAEFVLWLKQLLGF